ncbi:hypothetical protein Q7S_07105 [Rahnella aquatilis HX2]|nr:hypothetical protein Q7S_07105 [Rahnella aquatilis HX2]
MKVEYLVIIEIKNSFCKTKKSFLNFIQSDSEITIDGKKISFKRKVFNIDISEENSPSENNKIFHIKINNDDAEEINVFCDLLKTLRSLLHLASKNNIQTLWDDVGFFYSSKSYPIIYEIENLMRKLITKFMLTNVGVGWVETAIPDELKKTKRSKTASNENNYLYDTDFIQLSNFLFDSYRTEDIENLISIIKNHSNPMVTLAELHEFIPQSNWQRYFQKHVNCEATYLKSRWDKLYQLRCKIAHNNSFDKKDFDSVIELVDDIKPILDEAIQSLDKIKISESEREELAENALISNSQHYGDFILLWKKLESKIFELAYKNGVVSAHSAYNFAKVESELYSSKLIAEDVYNNIRQIRTVRNMIVHSVNNEISVEDLVFYNQLMKHLINLL